MKNINDIIEEKEFSALFDSDKVSRYYDQMARYSDIPDSVDSLKEIIQWLDDEKANNHILQKTIGLKELADWNIDEKGYFSRRDERFFKVVGINITSPLREVMTWNQPILDNVGTGVIGLLIRTVQGRSYCLMQAKAEVGNRNIVQIAPTVQFTPQNYLENEMLQKPFLFDEFSGENNFETVSESLQAEEGGRFYKKCHVHKILKLPENRELEIPASYRWFSYDQIRFFLNMGDFVNSCARSILSCLI